MVKNKNVKVSDFTISVSPRARNVWFKVSVEKGLEIVIPRGFSRRRLPELLIKEQKWIERKLKQIGQKRRLYPRKIPSSLPDYIHLLALDESWRVKYMETGSSIVRLNHLDSTLILTGDIEKKEKCRELLRQWLLLKAKDHLAPWLRRISTEKDLPFKKLTIKGQKTIWASCSPKKNLSINYKLLLIPRRLVRYIFIHELCHTVHLNHSRRFWKLVEKMEPNYRTYDKELRVAWDSLPRWVHKQ